MEVEIVDIHGSSILRFEPNAGSRRVRHLMGDDYVSLKVSSPTRIPLSVGCIAKTQYGNFEIASPSPNPTYNEDTGGYDYDIRFDAHYIKWKNKIFLYTQGDRRSEAAWSLTAPLEVHMEIFLKNLKKLGYTYGGAHYGFSIESSIENKSRLITYQSTSMLDALNEMAKAWNCEWWVDDNMIMFGRVQYGDYVDIEIGVNAANIQPSAQRDSFATRIYAFGSTRNIPPGYRESEEEEVVVNGIVQKRLMLPNGYPYVDVRSGLSTAEAIEGVVFADHIYPRTDGLISEVSAYDVIVNEDEEGKTEPDSEPAQNAGDGETSDQPNQEEGEERKKQRYWRFKDANFNFSNDYILPNTELRVVFQSGKLNGMDFAVAFNPNGKPEKLEDGTWNPDAQLFEIVANEDYGRLLPDDILKPEAGDKYVLYGWDVTKIEDLGLVAEAESELLDYARSYVAKMAIDPNTYTCPMMSDYMYGLDKHGNLNSAYSKHFDIGASVNLVNAAFFSGGSRQSRVVGYEMDFSEPWVCTLYVGEKASYSRLKNLESKVDALTLKGQTYTGSRGGGGSIYVIGTNDTTPPTDRNVYSSLRQRRMFLKRDADDRTTGKLASDKALEVGDFRSGASGAMLFKDALSGHTVLELDKLYVRLKAYFETLEIVHVNSVGGKQIITPGGGIRLNRVATKGLVEVEVEKTRPKVDAEGNPVLDDEGNPVMETYTETQLVDNGVPEGVYRCWFLAEQDGEKIENRFAVGDQAYSKTFNAKEGVSNKVSNNYYWRLVTGVGDDYIDLSMTDCDTGSDAPVAGDVVAHLGNRNDVDRQNALVFSAVDTFSPSITLYQGIDSYSHVGKDVVGYGVDKTTGKAFFRVYGDGYIGARDGSSFLQFIEGEGAQFKGKLSVGTTIGDGSTIESALQKATQSAIDTANENIGTFVTAVTAQIDELGKQIDRQIQTWFDTGIPTLDNHPAENWTTDADKEKHLGDLYFDNLTGLAYRFSKNDSGNYFWNDKVDSAIAKALADAAKAQDTADGKRRVFVSQPTDADEYDVGDLWVNANYPADASVYSNEILRSVSHKAANAPFTINHWTKSSKYTDDTRAEQVQQNVDNLATEVNAVHSTVNDMHDFTDEAFKDGIVDRAEAAKIEGYINAVQSIKAQADNAYSPVYDNALLAGVAKTELAEAMTAFTLSCTELISTVNTSVADGIVTAIERAAVDGKYTAFNTKYGDFTARLAAANAYIQDKINSTANDALRQIGSYSYLKKALKENTTIEGGLIQSSVLALGYTDAQGMHHIMAGSSGIYEASQLGGGIAFWAGGSRIDKFVDTTATDAASFVVRHDGSGYAAKGAIRFNADGTVEADPLSFFVGESTVGGLLASLQVVMAGDKPDYIIPKVPFQSLTVANGIRIGDGWLKYDAAKKAVYVEGLDGAAIGFYSKGWLSFRGANDGSGGSAVAGAANLSDLKDVSLGSLAAGQALVWNGARWVNSTIATSGLDEASLSNYLTSHGYATQQWANDRYYTKTEVDAKNFIKDAGDGRSLMFNYSANALGYDNFTWVAVWNGNTLQCCNKSLFATASALASGLSGKVNKSGDTMTGQLTIHNGTYNKTLVLSSAGADAKSKGPGILFNGSETDRSQGIVLRHEWYDTFTPGYGLAISRDTSLETGDANMWLYNTGRYISKVPTGTKPIDVVSTTLCTNLNADMLDGLHNGEVTARLVNYNNGGNVSNAVQFMQKANGWNAWDAPTQNWYSVIKLNHGNGDTYYSRVLAFDFHTDNIYTHRKHGGTDFGWHTLAFTDSTVANANSLGGKAAAQYVTTDTVQEITGRKTIRGASLKLLGSTTSNAANRHSAGVLAFQEHAYDDQFGIWGYFGGTGASQKLFIGGSGAGTSLANDQNGTTLTPYLTIEHTTGNLTVLGKIIKSGGTAAQFLMANGSVVTKKTATAPCDLGWVNNDTGNSSVPTIAVLAYWNGCYKGTSSNFQYCDRGRFGTMATASASDYLARSGGSMTNTNVVTNLNADLLDGLHLDSVRGYRVEHPAINASLSVGNVPFNALGMQHGTPIYNDPDFASGNNGVAVYNNAANGNVTITRIADNQASANSSGYILQIKVTGPAEPWTGGFVQAIQSRANAVFMQIFRAKIPVGYNVNVNSNQMGANYSDVWITSTAGTGKWEWYARVVYCGASGSFSSGGYVSLKGANATAANPLYWYLSHCQAWDLSKNNYGTLRAKFADALSASRTIWGQSFNGTGNVSGDMTGVGTITSTYYSLHNISNNPYLKFNVGGKITYVQALSTGIGVGPTPTALFVTNDSKVGIGTNSPSEKLSVNGWVGTIGNTGWYNITHGGGWYMTDTTWVRTYNNKGIYSGTGEIRNNSYFNRTVYEGAAWNNGYGAYNVSIFSNLSQTPLMVAYRNGYAVNVTGANRLFALELLNNGAEMHFAFGGSTKFSMTNTGEFFADGGIWTNGYMSFKGQNTSSDARQKRIIHDIHVPLTTIAKAPNIVFSWLDTGQLDMGSIAQYWQKHLPLSVYVRPNGYLGMDYSKVALACVISMASELLGVKDDVSMLKRELRQLKRENQQLKQQIDRMERRIA